jgi:hypothetical protein
MNTRKLTKAVSAAVLGASLVVVGASSALAHHWHHHHHASPYFVRYVGVGHVSYPVYRIDRYKIDYSHPTLVYDVGGWTLF